MSTVAVVIPSYNHADYIGPALESVAAQTLLPARIVVVDDGSTDRSLEVIRAFAAAHPSLDLRLIPQRNAGAHHAINRAVAEAGPVDYVAILNSDDLYEPERLAQCVAFLDARPRLQAICTGVRMIGPDGALLPDEHPKARRLRTLWSNPERDPAEWFGVANFAKTTSNFVIRAPYARQNPFRDYRYVHDYFFAAEAAIEGVFGVLPVPLLRYRTHPTNTIKADGSARVSAEMIRLHFDLLRELAARLTVSPEIRAAAVRYFRTLAGNAADFRAEVFLALIARLASEHPGCLEEWLGTLNPETFPELAAPPCAETRRAIDQAQLDAFCHRALRSRWTALGIGLGLLPNVFAETADAPAARLAWLQKRFRRSPWLFLGRLLTLAPSI